MTKSKTNNKSKRVREYLTSKPEAPNAEIIEALSKYGVQYHDITNVRASLRKKDPNVAAGEPSTVRRGRPLKVAASANGSSVSAKAYESGLQFVAVAGGIDSAIEILHVIRKIAQSKLA